MKKKKQMWQVMYSVRNNNDCYNNCGIGFLTDIGKSFVEAGRIADQLCREAPDEDDWKFHEILRISKDGQYMEFIEVPAELPDDINLESDHETVLRNIVKHQFVHEETNSMDGKKFYWLSNDRKDKEFETEEEAIGRALDIERKKHEAQSKRS